MSLDTIYTTTIEMADALSAGDIQLFYDLLDKRQQQLSELTTTPSPTSVQTLELIRTKEQEIEQSLIERRLNTGESLKRLSTLQDAAQEYTVSPRPRSILRDGLSG